MKFLWLIIVFDIEGDNDDFRPLKDSWRFYVDLPNSIVLHAIRSWLNYLDMDWTRLNGSRLVLTCEDGIELMWSCMPTLTLLIT